MYLNKDIVEELNDPANNQLRLIDFRVFRAPIKDEHIYAKVMLRHPETNIAYTQLLRLTYKNAISLGEELIAYATLDNPPEPAF